jgi:hypothetical protein
MKKMTPERETSIAADIGKLKQSDIIKKHRVGRETLRAIIAGMGDDYVSYRSQNGSILSAQDVANIRAMGKENPGISAPEIRKRLGLKCTRGQIWSVLTGHRWAGLEGVTHG